MDNYNTMKKIDNYHNIMDVIVRNIEVLANIIAEDKEIEMYVREYYKNLNGEINDELDNCDYRFAVYIAVNEEVFNLK